MSGNDDQEYLFHFKAQGLRLKKKKKLAHTSDRRDVGGRYLPTNMKLARPFGSAFTPQTLSTLGNFIARLQAACNASRNPDAF